jgi:hypothetical protein
MKQSQVQAECNIFNVTFLGTINKLTWQNLVYPQTSNNIIKDSFVLLEITETKLIKVIHSLKNKKQQDLMTSLSPYLLKEMCALHGKTTFMISRCIS